MRSRTVLHWRAGQWLQFARTPTGVAVGVLALWWALLGLFHVFPGIDIAAQRSLFALRDCPMGAAFAQVCGFFPVEAYPLLSILRRILFWMPTLGGLVLLWHLCAALQHHGATYDATSVRRMTIVLATLLLGPLALVNGYLKEVSGRPRPYETDLFGGDLPFVPAGTFTDLCQSNCSFVSGEAAGAGWLICLALLLPARLRFVVLPWLISASLVTPALRVAFGRHYLSDALLGWLSTLVIFAILVAIFGWNRTPAGFAKSVVTK